MGVVVRNDDRAACLSAVAAGSAGIIRLYNLTDGNASTAQGSISSVPYILSDDLSVVVDAGENQDVNILVQIQGDGTNLMFVRNFKSNFYYAMAWWQH